MAKKKDVIIDMPPEVEALDVIVEAPIVAPSGRKDAVLKQRHRHQGKWQGEGAPISLTPDDFERLKGKGVI